MSSVSAEAARHFISQHYDVTNILKLSFPPISPLSPAASVPHGGSYYAFPSPPIASPASPKVSSPPPQAAAAAAVVVPTQQQQSRQSLSRRPLSRDNSNSALAVNPAHIFALAYYRAVVLDVIERWSLVHSNLKQQAVTEFVNSYMEARVTSVGLRLASKLTVPPTPLNESLDVLREEFARIHTFTVRNWAIETVLRRKFPEKVVMQSSSPKEIEQLQESVMRSKSLVKNYAMNDFCHAYYETLLAQLAHDYVCQLLNLDSATIKNEVSRELPELMDQHQLPHEQVLHQQQVAAPEEEEIMDQPAIVRSFVDSYVQVRESTMILSLHLVKKAREVVLKNYMKQSYNTAITIAARKKKLGIVKVGKKSLSDPAPVIQFQQFHLPQRSPARPTPNLTVQPQLKTISEMSPASPMASPSSPVVPASREEAKFKEDEKPKQTQLDDKLALEIRRQQVEHFNKFVILFVVLSALLYLFG